MSTKSIKSVKIILFFLCIALLALSLSRIVKDNTVFKSEGYLEVHFFDVGKADSILLINSGETMLIDAGDTNAKDIIIPYIKNMGIKKLDAVIFTHPHKDHIGSADSVIKSFEIGQIYMPGITHTTRAFEKLLDAIDEKSKDIIIPDVGDKIKFGNCDVTVLAPMKEYDNINDNSIVLMLKYQDTKFLFTGDIERASERDLVDAGADLKADVLKVAHHGSSSSSKKYFLDEVKPKYAVISCGQDMDNESKNPSKKVLDSLKSIGAEVFRTDEMGTIVIKSDGKKISFDKKP